MASLPSAQRSFSSSVGPSRPSASPVIPLGDFRLDGSFNPDLQPTDRSVLRGFILQLIKLRREDSSRPPGYFAELIRCGPRVALRAFPRREDWERAEDWISAPATTSAEAAVRFAFQGAQGPRSSPDPPRIDAPIPAHVIAELVASLSARIERLPGPRRRMHLVVGGGGPAAGPPDEAWFAGGRLVVFHGPPATFRD